MNKFSAYIKIQKNNDNKVTNFGLRINHLKPHFDNTLENINEN